MNFTFEKTDLYLILLFFGFAIPIGLLDWDYENWTEAFWERTIYVFLNVITLYVVVFVLFARFLPEKKFFLLFITLILFLLFMGAVSVQLYCILYTCKTSPWGIQPVFSGFLERINEIGILAAFIAGKKFYDAQLRFFKIEKEKKESELKSLKSQIDPHFLFNNLNTVDALIDSSPKMAKVYINRLAQLYRYLIANKDYEVVPLDEELAFAQNYMYLIQCRFGEAFQFKINKKVTETDDLLIPPGALQTLLENIVKHNNASPDEVINSSITISSKAVVVSNNVKSKGAFSDSTGIGLANLKSRYALLTDQPISIHSNEYFTVELPLLKQVN